MLKKVLLGLGVLLIGMLAFAAMRPSNYHVEVTRVMAAPPQAVFDQLDDFRSWGSWSPWDKLDPQMKKTFTGPEAGAGASYAWQGNDQVGRGRMTILEARAPTHITYRLEFMEPFAAVASTRFTLKAEGPETTRVTWAMDGEHSVVGKVFGLFIDMNAAIGADFERGLGALEREARASTNAAGIR